MRCQVSITLINRSLLLLIGLVSIISSHTLAENAEITIGAPLALSGDAAQWGEAERDGIILAMEEFATLNPQFKMPRVIFEDTRSSQAGTAAAVNKLISIDRASYFVGITWLDTFRGGLPPLERLGAPTLLSSTSISLVNPVHTDRGSLAPITAPSTSLNRS